MVRLIAGGKQVANWSLKAIHELAFLVDRLGACFLITILLLDHLMLHMKEYPVRLGSSEYAEQGCGRILCPACHDLERCQVNLTFPLLSNG